MTRLPHRWPLPGLVAGAAFLAVDIAGGAITTTPWGLPDGIARVLGVHSQDYRFAPAPVLVGIAVHLTVSTLLGGLYLLLAGRLGLRGRWLVLGGWLFSGFETPITLWGILHTVLPAATFHYFLDSVGLWVSILGHNVYGIVLGLLAGWIATPSGRAAELSGGRGRAPAQNPT